jgi:glucose/arabinose dehydrogenase
MHGLTITTMAAALLAAGAAQAAAPAAPADPCAPGQYAADDYFPTPAFPGQTAAPLAKPSSYKVETLVGGLMKPRAIAFIGGGRMLISTGPNQLRIVDKAGKLSEPLAGAPEALPAENGGYDIALDRGFTRNRTLYLAYRAPRPGEVVAQGRRPVGIGRVVRAQLSKDGRSLEGVKVIHEGGYMRRILALPDGTLIFATTGAAGDVSQRLGDPNGKVLRINPDGSIPKDNPFAATAGALPAIYTIGHRDPDGLARDPKTGDIWLTEHGVRGGDELNLIKPGKNYGFPIVTYGRQYDGAAINNGKTAQDGMEQPVYFWEPDIAPGNVAVYRGGLFREWEGNVFVSGLVSKQLIRLVMDKGRVVAQEPLLKDRCERIRDVAEGPDGALYVLTDEAKGALLRLTPKK